MARTKTQQVEDFEFLQHWRARGLEQLARRVGDIVPAIEARLAAGHAFVDLLEIGCGFGTALMELRRQFGDRVRLFGLNRAPRHGGRALICRNALLRDICTEADLKGAALPAILFGNASNGLPFAGNSFDIVYSQCAFHYIEDKVRCLREVNRLLRADGEGRIDIRPMTAQELLPAELRGLGHLCEDGARIDLSDLIGGIAQVRWREAELGPYIAMTKGGDFLEDLVLEETVQLRELDYDWAGVMSVYRRDSGG